MVTCDVILSLNCKDGPLVVAGEVHLAAVPRVHETVKFTVTGSVGEFDDMSVIGVEYEQDNPNPVIRLHENWPWLTVSQAREVISKSVLVPRETGETG
jgi:hypothetical protein